MLTGGQAAVRSLAAHGVRHLFGLPGVQLDWLYNAVYDEGRPFDVITTRHEQGAAYMALGYALTSDRVGVVTVVPGPGLLNAGAALATAYGTGARIVALVGQIPSAAIDKGHGLLHEIVDQPKVVEPITRWRGRAWAPSDVSPLIAEAFHQAMSADPRPVMLEIPPDVLEARRSVEITPPTAPEHPEPDEAALGHAARLLAQATSPLIVVGGGALEAGTEVRRLAEAVGAPVTGHRRGRGVIDERHPLFVPTGVAHALWKDVDVVLAVGTRMRLPLDWGVDDRLRQVWINPDRRASADAGPLDVVVAARAEEALPQLLHRLPAHTRDRPDLDPLRLEYEERLGELQPQLDYVRALRAALADDDIVVADLTQVGYVMRLAYETRRPKTFLFPGYPGTLGWAFPTALGAKVANPDKLVVAVAGDGGFLYAASELATAVHHGIATVTVLFDDGAYGNVQLLQRELYDGRVLGSDLTNPDFVAFAESFGAYAERVVDGPEALGPAVARAAETGRPAVLVVPQGRWPSPWGLSRLGAVRA